MAHTIYWDFRKAFDTMPHGKLLGRLDEMGLGKGPVRGLASGKTGMDNVDRGSIKELC